MKKSCFPGQKPLKSGGTTTFIAHIKRFDMTPHRMTVAKTAHFYTLGTPGPNVRQLWIACHGYAQLADEFLQDIKILDDGHTLMIVPEGLNHFYKKGFSGPVGANWMTRHFREDAIADNAAYLQQIYDQYVALISPETRIVLLGFSQGTATICRWIMEKKPHFHDLVLWAGLPPEDLDYKSEQKYLSDKNLYLIYGTQDPFLTEDRMQTVQEIERNNGIDFDEQAFQGGHEIPADFLQQLQRNLSP